MVSPSVPRRTEGEGAAKVDPRWCPVRCEQWVSAGLPPTGLGKELLGDLEDSWNSHINAPTFTLDNTAACVAEIRTLFPVVVAKRESMERYLMAAASAYPMVDSPLAWSSTGHRLLRIAGRAVTATLPELVRTLVAPDELEALNPYLFRSGSERALLRCGLLVWCQLAVLEDKLARLHRLCGGGAPLAADLARELSVVRTWPASQYPYWVVFEVDAGLQIRPLQHKVAEPLLDAAPDSDCTPGPIVQLNMGLG